MELKIKDLNLKTDITQVKFIQKIFKLINHKSRNVGILITYVKFILEGYFSRLDYQIIEAIKDETVGAATLSWNTYRFINLKADERWIFTQRCCRPSDCRSKRSNVNVYSRSAIHTQFQILSRPELSFKEIKVEVLELIIFLGLDPINLTFKLDNWSNRIIGAYGVGFEVCYNDIEIMQCTIFERYLGNKIRPVNELVIGLERLIFVILNLRSDYVKTVLGYSVYDRYYSKVRALKHPTFTEKGVLDVLDLIPTSSTLRKKWGHLLQAIHGFNELNLNLRFDGFSRLALIRKIQSFLKFF